MNDDPTRVMGQPDRPDRGQGGGRPHGNMRLVVACLIAVIVGLVIAILVISGGGDGDEPAPTGVTTPLEPSTEAPTGATGTDGTDGSLDGGTGTGTEAETEEPDAGEEAEEAPAPEEEGGSGGLEVP